MHIKQVIIQGFKSYKEQTIVEPFDPGLNIVVGKNGAGKSNIFAALQFVLSDEFSKLPQDQRQALLHEGPGPRVTSASVEIIFDNADGRIPGGHAEVHLRRVIGTKKDTFFLNKSTVTSGDVAKLLETAGFSKTNPYYIVKQGEINKLATSADSARLKLLRDVAGVSTYDKSFEESEMILRDSTINFEDANERLNSMRERLERLEEEKEELKEYQHWDKQKRYLEYTIYKREMKDIGLKLHELTSSEEKNRAELVELGSAKESAMRDHVDVTKRYNEAKKEVESTKEELEAIRVRIQELVRKRTRLTLTKKDLDSELNAEEDTKMRCRRELEELEPLINEKQAELDNIKIAYDELLTKENECSLKLAVAEQKRKELLAKQGRGRQFSSKEVRDAWIKKELETLEVQIESKERHLEELKQDLSEDDKKRKKLEESIAMQTIELDVEQTQVVVLEADSEKLCKKKEKCQAARKQKYREEHILQTELSGRREELARVEQTLKSIVGKLVLDGAESVRKVLDSFRARGDLSSELDGYYGQLIDKISCDQTLYRAVGVVGGNRLFYHIVATDRLSTKILKEMNNQGLPGEVTFMSLNRLSAKVHTHPETEHSRPLISLLEYEQLFFPALSYIFGKTLLCRDVEYATTYARKYSRNCVTIEGDQASAKGSLTGGHVSVQTLRIEIHKTRLELLEQISDLQNRMNAVKEDIEKIDEDANVYIREIERNETLTNKERSICEKRKFDIDMMKEDLKTIENCRTSKVRSCSQCVSNLEAMRVTKLELEKERDQELLSQLTSEDHEQIDALNDEIRELTSLSKSTFAERREREVEKNQLENQLTNNLRRRRDELMQNVREITVEERRKKSARCSTKLAEIKDQLTIADNDHQALTAKLANALKKQKIESSLADESKVLEKKVQEKIEIIMKDVIKWASKERALRDKFNECAKKITELGALPNPDTYSKFSTMSTKQLFREIERTNEELKNYSHVNKKALDQFVSFSELQENLVKRKEELDRGNEKIAELMAVLQQRKNENIQFTFKQISRYFKTVFKKLVPTGDGELVIKTADGDLDSDGIIEIADSEKITGVGIRVSFTGQATEMSDINQLSGGQKSLVALAMIFAIQKCDPAPFYLFDEVDQALDTAHREAVAEMIHELSSNAQFIATTFRPELLSHAKKFYGVTYQGKVSHIGIITQQEATDFVTDDNSH